MTDLIDGEQITVLAQAAGKDAVMPILDAFWASNEELLVQLQQDIAAKNADAIAKTGHALKGSAANLGATRVSATAKDVEFAGKAGDVETASEAATRLPAEIEETKTAFAALMDQVA